MSSRLIGRLDRQKPLPMNFNNWTWGAAHPFINVDNMWVMLDALHVIWAFPVVMFCRRLRFPIRFDSSFPSLESRESSIFSSFIVIVSYLFGNSQHFWPGFTAHPNHGWQPKATILFTGSFIDFLHSESVKFTNFWRRWKHRFENNRGRYTYWLCDQSLTAAERWVRNSVNHPRPKRQTHPMIKIKSKLQSHYYIL